MTALEQLGAFVAGSPNQSFSPEVRETVRLHLVNTVAAWVAGTATPEGTALLELTRSIRGRAGLENYGDGLLDRTMLCCALARLSEVDDIHLASLTTPGAVLIPTALNVAQALGAAAQERIAEAVVVGYDAMVRLGVALGGQPILYRGIWPTYFTAPFGAAAVAARLLGLTAAQSANALAMALTMASPSVGHHGGAKTSRWISVGQKARAGVWAALAAKEGFGNDVGVFEGKLFPSVYNITPDPAVLTADLGEVFSILQTSFKPWCAARQTMAASQAMKEIVQAGVAPATIRAVTAFVPTQQVGMIDHGVMSGERTSHLTSVQYQIALAAFGSDAVFDVKQALAQLPAEICAFMSKVKVEGDDTLLTLDPVGWAARVEVTAASGKLEKQITCIPGDPRRPFDEAQVA